MTNKGTLEARPYKCVGTSDEEGLLSRVHASGENCNKEKSRNINGYRWIMMNNRQGWINNHRRPFKPEAFRVYPQPGGPNVKDCALHEMKWFDMNDLKKVTTEEKNTLPNNQTIHAEIKGINETRPKLSQGTKRVHFSSLTPTT